MSNTILKTKKYFNKAHKTPPKTTRLHSPVNVVLPVCGKVIVDDQGYLLHINTTCLRGTSKSGDIIRTEEEFNTGYKYDARTMTLDVAIDNLG